MIRLDVAPNSPEWERARLGLPTASCFDKIITPSTLKLSKSAGAYRNQLLAEWVYGHAIDWTGKSEWMDRGTEMEPDARAVYELIHDVQVLPGGFCLRDDMEAGASPDGLVGEDGGVEVKCPAIHTHIGYLLEPELLVAEYKHQVQGNLYITGRQWWDVFAYHPELPAVERRITRDEEFIAALDKALNAFVTDLSEAKKKLSVNLTPAGA